MTAGLVTIGRRQYAVGLYWENSPGGSVSQAAKEAARQPNQEAAYFAVRSGNKNGRLAQFGLAPSGSGFRYGQPALTACLANQQPGSWAGAFRLREATVVVIVRDDLIVPDGDLLFFDETEARDRLLQEMGFGGLQKVYAPEAWGVPGADTMPLSLLLNDKTDVTLQPVEIPRKVIIGIVGSLVFVVLAIGGGWYLQSEKEHEEMERMAQIQSMQKAQEEARRHLPEVFRQENVDYPPPERAWEKKPLAMAVIQNCVDGLKRVPAVVVGWSLDSVKCNGVTMDVSWNRSGTGYASVPPGAVLSDQASNASISLALPPLRARPPEDLLDVAYVTKRILGQNWGTILSRMSNDPQPPPPDFQGKKWDPPPAPWVKRSFTISAPVLPWMLGIYFANFPGVVVNSMKMPGKGAWVIEGAIYENRH